MAAMRGETVSVMAYLRLLRLTRKYFACPNLDTWSSMLVIQTMTQPFPWTRGAFVGSRVHVGKLGKSPEARGINMRSAFFKRLLPAAPAVGAFTGIVNAQFTFDHVGSGATGSLTTND